MSRTDRAAASRLPAAINRLVVSTLLLSVLSLLLEGSRFAGTRFNVLIQVVDFAVLLLLIVEAIWEAALAESLRRYLRSNAFGLAFLAGFSLLFAYNKYLLFTGQAVRYGALPGAMVILRNLFLLLKVFGRIRRLAMFVRSITSQPAQTVMLSFLLVILFGTILLMLPLAVASRRIGFLDALFTATSAVCVTGLIVVDTGSFFSLAGQLIVLLLIQIGGLGIMILSFFVAFVLRRTVSLEDKLLISYMLSEKDMNSLGRSIRSIIYITLAVEGGGALLLFGAFAPRLGWSWRSVFVSVFHAVSGFCNAGFSVFADSLERFRSSLPANLLICLLIISGGISFAVIINLKEGAASRLSWRRRAARRPPWRLSLNSRLVLTSTAFLIAGGLLLFYSLEHGHSLAGLDLGTQYLASFFQSVTQRTAGFNTVPLGGLRAPTYLFMIVFMFIGAASGSTAGGIKVNTVGVILAYVRSLLRDQENTILYRHVLAKDLVLRALLIFLFGITAVLSGTLLLSISEEAPFIQLFFEAASAFGTVGLSAGVTAGLSAAGKCVIIVLMFIGRVGPLTLLAAAVRGERRVRVEYPQADILIG
jgi:trk system potassium uptake protein TrkH